MTLFFHTHTHSASESLAEGLLHDVLLDGVLDTLKVIPFLFLTYLLMEFIEHRASSRTFSVLSKSGSFGPAIGGVLGVLPQCAFSAMAANLYTGRVITLGTLFAAFLSTSDEMLPMMISENVSAGYILPLLAYKLGVAIFAGFAIDLVLSILGKKKEDINIDQMCENDNCHCERGIFHSAIHHTLTITAFIFVTTLIINLLIYFVGAERLGEAMGNIPVISHLISAIIGLIPGCAISVALTSLGLHGIISTGTMLAGLFSGAGIGILILLRLNKRRRENLIIAALLVAIGFVFGMIADLVDFASLLK